MHSWRSDGRLVERSRRHPERHSTQVDGDVGRRTSSAEARASRSLGSHCRFQYVRWMPAMEIATPRVRPKLPTATPIARSTSSPRRMKTPASATLATNPPPVLRTPRRVLMVVRPSSTAASAVATTRAACSAATGARFHMAWRMLRRVVRERQDQRCARSGAICSRRLLVPAMPLITTATATDTPITAAMTGNAPEPIPLCAAVTTSPERATQISEGQGPRRWLAPDRMKCPAPRS